MFADKNRAACEALAMRGARASIKLPVGVGATMEYDGRAKVETAYGYALPASYRGVPVFVKLAHKHVAVVRECFTPWFHKHYSFSADMENETNNLLRMRSMPHPNVAMMHPAFQQLISLRTKPGWIELPTAVFLHETVVVIKEKAREPLLVFLPYYLPVERILVESVLHLNQLGRIPVWP